MNLELSIRGQVRNEQKATVHLNRNLKTWYLLFYLNSKLINLIISYSARNLENCELSWELETQKLGK